MFPSKDASSMGGGFPGFSTAGGKKVNISKKAIAQAKVKFNEDDEENVPASPDLKTEAVKPFGINVASFGGGGFPGFSTAGGKKVNVSEKAIAQAKAKFTEDEDNHLDAPDLKTKAAKPDFGFLGFSTAGGKRVTVSEKAIAQAKAKFTDDENSPDVPDLKSETAQPDVGFPGFSTAGGKRVPVSKKAIAQAKAKFTENEDISPATPDYKTEAAQPHVGFIGFSTAGGKRMTISEKAIAQAKAKFTEDEGSHSYAADFNTETAKPSGMNPALLGSGFPGFSTAGGKKMNVSEKAIAEAKAKFTEDENISPVASDFKREAAKTGGGFLGFSTAGGKKVTISEEAIAQAKAKLTDTEEDSPNTPDPNTEASPPVVGLLGFSTAGGKRVRISEKAVAQAKAKFTEDEYISPATPDYTTEAAQPHVGPIGFSTAGGKRMAISEKAIAQAKAKLVVNDEEDRPVTPDCTNLKRKMSTAFTSTPKSSIKPLVSDTEAKQFSPIVHVSPDDEISMEIEECTRLLLEDAAGSDDDAQWAISIEGPSSLSAIKTNEPIPSIKLTVVRVYPIIYCVDGGDGSKVYLSGEAYKQRTAMINLKTEKLHDEMYPEIQQQVRERLISSSQEFSKLSNEELENLTGEELVRYILSHDDGSEAEIRSRLSLRKQMEFEDERIKFEEKVGVAVREELLVRMKKEGPEKRPSSVLKVRVVDCDTYTYDDLKAQSGIVSIWNPSEEVMNGLSEGHVYEFSNIKPNSFQPFQEVKLSSTKETRIMPVVRELIENSMTRKLTNVQDVLCSSFSPAFSEFDTVGIVTTIDPYLEKDGQMIYLSDQWQNILKIKFWNSLKDAGLHNVIKVRSIIACCNLQWRMTSSATGTAFAQEISTFIVNPKVDYLRDVYNEIRSAIESQDDFILSEETSALNISNPVVQSKSLISRKRLSESRLFSYRKKRLHSESEQDDSLNTSNASSDQDQSTPVPKRTRLSRKFIPPRRLSPSTKT